MGYRFLPQGNELIMKKVDNEVEELKVPMGYRFSPHGNELIMHYLTRKILGLQLPANIIKDIDLYAYDPHQLPISEFKYGKPNEAYFFTHLVINKDAKGQPRRTTNNGYWKDTDRDKQIFHGETMVGWKKTLIFYGGKAPTGIKSSWTMHEFRANPSYLLADAQDETLKRKIESYVVCRITCKQQ